MINSKEDIYVEAPSGDVTLIEIENIQNRVVIKGPNFKMEMTKDSAFDFLDALNLIIGQED